MLPITFLYEYKTIYADSNNSLRDIYIAMKNDRIENNSSRCWEPPIRAISISTNVYRWEITNGWDVYYKHSESKKETK